MKATRSSCASALLVTVLIASGCNRNDQSGQGGPGPNTQRGQDRVVQNQPPAAPEPHPEFGEVGQRTFSRVVTNGEGHLGLSIYDTNPPGQAPSRQPENPDQALSQRVKVALSTGTTGTTGTYSENQLLGISVTSSNGVVTLAGPVGNERAKELLGARARSIHGVREVHNELSVVPGAPASLPGVPSGRSPDDRPQ